jgi:hypothetical protein
MLRGVVMDSTGAPIEGASVTLASHATSTGGAGEFVLPYPKGRNTLEIRCRNYSPLQASVPAEIIGAEMELLAYLDPTGGVTVTGKVTDATGAPIAGVLVRGLAPYVTTIITDAAGRFAGVAQGDLWFEHPDYAMKKAEIRPGVQEISVSLEAGGALRVRVLRGNAPVAGARVSLRGPLSRVVDGSTDDAGYVQFDHLPSAEYSLTAHTLRGDMATKRSGSTLVKGGETTECTLLVPESYPCTLRGKVLDENGVPLQNATLCLSPEGYPDALRQVPVSNDGTFEAGVELGKTAAYVSAGEEWRPVGEGKRVVSAIAAGDSFYEEFRFRKASPCEVTIVDMDDIPVEQAYIAIAGGFQWSQGKMRFLLTMPSGQFQLAALSAMPLAAYDLEMKRGGSVLLDPAQSTGVRLRLDRSLTTLSGKVTEPDGTPLSGICVRLFRKEESQRDSFGNAYACSNDQGFFDLGPLAVGETYNGGAFSLGNPPPVTSIPVNIALEQNPQPLHLVMIRQNAIIRGTVVYADGLPVENEGASVSAVAGEATAARASTDKTGAFELRVAPGEYTVWAQSASGRQGPEALVTAPSEALVLTIPENAPEKEADAESPEGPEHEHAKQVLRDMGIVFKMFANEAKDTTFPPLDTKFGAFRPVMELLYPEYLSDPSTVARVSGRETVKLCYLGYAVVDESAGLAFLDAYEQYGPEGLAGEDIENDETPQGAILRLREGVDRFFITDINDPGASSRAQAGIPVLWEVPGNRAESGGWVLYMDGHVEWKPYPGEFPMTEAFITRLRSLMTE